ncbi:hypothetical protein BASA81_000411 [Batrachochytrium salamandrivorans]|nr:hypothetical protein BASA81_000411 [Batrachochytrium salamandrivorans]
MDSPAPVRTATAPSPPALGSFNQKNPAIRRILADARELTRDPSDQLTNTHTHTQIRGPQGSEFEGGRYHGKILLPSEYPFKPPNIVFLTPNGRWETRTKICLSMSSFHPEEWQPAWGIRTMLEALISFMPSPGDGALGALDASQETRVRLAKDSLHYSHPQMPELPELGSCKYVKGKDVAEALSMLSMKAKTEDNADEEAVVKQPAQGEEEQPKEEEERAAVDEEEVHATTAPLQPLQDSVDELLKAASVGIFLALFCLVYRKLLLAYAPEM